MRFLRTLVSAFSVTVALARPISASELHCARAAETRSAVPVGSDERMAVAAHWSAAGLDNQACGACAMPRCPGAHCPVAGLLDSPAFLVALAGPPDAASLGESSKPFSQTPEPPTPPPNTRFSVFPV
jgi:hypothetical protein